jgi:hypothetical protein
VPLPTDVPDSHAAVAGRLLPPQPNPARGGVWLAWELESPASLTLDVLSVSGQRVRTLTPSGRDVSGRTWWDARDHVGRRVPPGVYYVRGRTADRSLDAARVVVAP